jgi:hypothetical protein
MMSTYIAHLASGTNPLETACGEPWQGWQEPFDADKAVPPDRYRVRPPYDKPQPHKDPIDQCQACFRRLMEWKAG